MQENAELPSFQLLLESEEAEELSEYWQKQCCFLYNTIKQNIEEGSIEPLTCKAAEGERAGLITLFSTLSASGLSIKSVGHIFDLVKMWLDVRPRAKVVMKFPNGNLIEISEVTGFSKSDVLDLFEKSIQTSQV
ncbi:hypothetical protein EQO05_10720 [Methanosarcina sp. MSH10X1]|uniref:hypothetical protein n=1 Tax=Methanosarcina sp. MSH10X1 TaxID=2507075 RepID=UPI000FFBA615|nr:hypothetical protein [Methanosarcina sp. MSH10X1]RXA18458.1 hypothetical protein EQO05_10720 [Methanosarcina sp. MSH10X1]